MFSFNEAIAITDEKNLVQASCLSTDIKPTTGIANGSTCIEINTGKIFMFDEDGAKWDEL